MSQEDKIAYFGVTDFRNEKTKFGIKNEDRSRHVYVIGKTGMGKSTLLENMAAQDILNGEGMCFVDPHGSAIDALIEYIPENRITDVVYFAPFDTDFPISFNVLEDVDADKRHLVMAGLISSFKKIWPDSFSARMEYILSNTLLALLEFPEATLLGVNRMLAEKDYRDMVIKNITDASVKAFWVDEYNKWDPRYAKEAGAAIQNKIGQFTSNPTVRNIIGQTKTSFNMRDMMDNKKILFVNLSKGQVGESNANLLGGMLITKLYLGAMSRADVGASGIKKLPPFFFFVDEFQNFANESFADILSEARKYKLNLTVAHQYVDQMEEGVAAAIFGNVGTMITFRIGATDAEVFEKQFTPTFTAEDIVNLGKYQIYLSLMIDGIGSRPFSASTLPPIKPQDVSMREHVIANSRYFYAQERHVVEKNIEKWYEPVKKQEKRRINNPEDILKKGDKKIFKAKNTGNKDNKKDPHEPTSAFKKASKDADEKEAELEMKQVVSPKLNALLDSFGSKKKKSDKIDKVLNNIKKKDSIVNTPNERVSDSVKKKIETLNFVKKNKNADRGANKSTKSSLSEILSKAISSNNKNKIDEDNSSKENNETKKKEKKIIISSNRSRLKTKGDNDGIKNVSQKDIKQIKRKDTKEDGEEVPESILKDIFK